MSLIDEWAKADGKRPKRWLMDWLHKYQWNASALAPKLGIKYTMLCREMKRLGIPTLRDYLSFSYDGEFGTVRDHAKRHGVCASTAMWRYAAGWPLHAVFRPVSEQEIADMELLVSSGMTADEVSGIALCSPEVVQAVTGAKRAESVRKRDAANALKKLKADNPCHDDEMLAPYLKHL